MQEGKKLKVAVIQPVSLCLNKKYLDRAFFSFLFLVDLRSPPQSGVMPTAPLLCSKTLGGEVPWCPKQSVHYRDHEGCCRRCTPFDGHS